MKRLQHCHDIGDLRAVAQTRIPRAVFDFMDGIQVADLFLDAAKAFARQVRKS